MGAPLVRRELRGRPARMLAVFATVVVAVSFTTGAFGFSEQLGRLLAPAEGLAAAFALPEGTVVVTGRTDGLATATALDESLLARARAVEGVGSATGSYDQPVAFDVGWRVLRSRPGFLRGIVLSSTWDPSRWQLVAGRLPDGPQEVALDEGGRLVSGLGLGERGDLQLPTGTFEVDVVGIVAPVGAGPGDGLERDALGRVSVPLDSGHVLLDPAHAPELLAAVGRVDRILVIPAGGTSPDELGPRLEEALGDGVRVDAVTSAAAATQQTVGTIQEGIRLATGLYAAVTLLVSVLVVVNVLSVIVARRTRELGLLRLVGAPRRTLVRLVVGEALLVGLAASVVGGALGVVLAWLGARAVRVAGVAVRFSVTREMVLVALGVGVVVTLVGSLVPALRAARVSPLDAFSDTRAGADRRPRAAGALVALVAGFGAAALLTLREPSLDGWVGAAVALAVLVGFVGLARLSRWIVVPLAAVARGLAGWTGVSVRLGVGNARRQPSRTAGAASTLMVGLALVALVATVGASARDTIDRQVRASGAADLYVERRGLVRVSTDSLERFLALDPGVIDEVAEVIALDGTVSGPAGSIGQAVVSTLPRASRVADLGVDAGEEAPDGPGVMVSERAAERLGVGVGDAVVVRSTSGRELSLPVRSTYRNTAVFGSVIVDRASAESIAADGTFERAAVDLRPGVDPNQVRFGFSAVTDLFHEVYVNTPEEYVQLRLSVADVALRVIGVLLAGALGVGFLGLAGTLALSTSERRRELVTLRAVGASRLQVRMLVWIEATFIGVVAVLVGMTTGLVLGWFGTAVAPEGFIGRPVVPWSQLGLIAATGVVVAWLVSLGVAGRAARVPPADAGRMD